tara:strand:+ start:467 stop:679 length:213 start_codon:yes stop_codon:yes gene_type:complete
MQNSTITQPTILVEKKESYGNTLYYPADDSQKSALRVLTKGQKTLTYSQCVALIDLGFHIEIKTDNPFTK